MKKERKGKIWKKSQTIIVKDMIKKYKNLIVRIEEVEIERDNRPSITFDQWEDYNHFPNRQELNEIQQKSNNPIISLADYLLSKERITNLLELCELSKETDFYQKGYKNKTIVDSIISKQYFNLNGSYNLVELINFFLNKSEIYRSIEEYRFLIWESTSEFTGEGRTTSGFQLYSDLQIADGEKVNFNFFDNPTEKGKNIQEIHIIFSAVGPSKHCVVSSQLKIFLV
jgi:hypothetical protein